MKSKHNKHTGIVYSTVHGKLCPKCGKPLSQCLCSKRNQGLSHVPHDGIVRISRKTKGRKGAGVSIISGIALEEKELKALARQLKQKCGSGGTVKSGTIEIQGDHRELLKQELTKQGYTVKLSGG